MRVQKGIIILFHFCYWRENSLHTHYVTLLPSLHLCAGLDLKRHSYRHCYYVKCDLFAFEFLQRRAISSDPF
uniref:Uncharacterized protein n=1 Tax=Octopus bimaculoides TaxID=37653 RepID=A0A0L8GIL9_OCTBM